MSYTETLAQYCVALSSSQIPQRVRDTAKIAVFDWLASCFGGTNSPDVAHVLAYARTVGGQPQASVIGYDATLSAPLAALVNGTAAHSLDFDDTIVDCALHPGAVVVSAAMAAGQWRGASGSDTLTAIIAGYEVMVRIGRAVNAVPKKAHHGQGFHPTGTCGTIGAATAAGKLLGLSAGELTNAMGIAASFSSGLMEFLSDGATVKRVHPGWAAHGGVTAALLAKEGITGPRTALEGRDGFFRAFSPVVDDSRMLERLGDDYAIEQSAIKLYPACHHCHPPVDALAAMRGKRPFSHSDVSYIDIRHPGPSHYLIGEPEEKKRRPANVLEAQMSLAYCVAVALIDGELSPRQFAANRLNDPQTLALMDVVRSIPDAEFDKQFSADCWPAEVTVGLKDGTVLVEGVAAPKGFPNVPASWSDLRSKLQALSGMDEEEARGCESVVGKLDELPSIGDFVRSYSGASPLV